MLRWRTVGAEVPLQTLAARDWGRAMHHYWQDHGRWKARNDRDWRVEQAQGTNAAQAQVSVDEASLRLDSDPSSMTSSGLKGAATGPE